MRENRVNRIKFAIIKSGTYGGGDMMRAMEDKAFQKQLFEEFGL